MSNLIMSLSLVYGAKLIGKPLLYNNELYRSFRLEVYNNSVIP
ncbi:hypothetical protein [Tetragenococcus halophilus]|nr:hypothetical protein [Tetragenococcus halophilus]